MDKAAISNKEIAERMDLYKFRVAEELYDFKNDPNGLVNLINNPDLQKEKQRLKDLLYKEMKRSKDPLTSEFKERFIRTN
jgi:N-sulfoglucosamine sulfohydrolase